MLHSLRKVVVVAGAGVCVVLVGAPAAAQSGAPSAEGEPARVVPGLVFTPSISMGVVHDDNPVLATDVGQPVADVATTVRPILDLTYTAKHASLTGVYRGSLERYRTFDAYDSYDQGGHAEYRQQFSRRVSFAVRDNFSLAPTTDLVEVAGVPFTRTGTTQNTLTSTLALAVSKHLQLSVGYHFQWLEFNRPEEPISALLQGGTAHRLNFGVRRAVTARLRLGADYNVQRANVGEQFEREKFTIQNVEGVAIIDLSPTMTLEAGGGISRLALPEGRGTHFGPAGRFSLRKRTEYALFSIHASGSFVPAFGFGGSFRNREVRAAVEVPFARRRATADGSVAWQESEPVLQGALALQSLWVKASLGYSFQRWLRLQGFYNGAFQDTTLVGGRVNRNRIGVQLVTGYPMRLR
jgi:hypothetical protein